MQYIKPIPLSLDDIIIIDDDIIRNQPHKPSLHK